MLLERLVLPERLVPTARMEPMEPTVLPARPVLLVLKAKAVARAQPVPLAPLARPVGKV